MSNLGPGLHNITNAFNNAGLFVQEIDLDSIPGVDVVKEDAGKLPSSSVFRS
jgi:hypothetical protein